jgi:SAM-dependent methyltransferase
MWSWDESLYAGSAPFYTKGRVAYPDEVADVLADALGLDGTGRLLDVGCGPGSLTLLLAPHFAEVVGLDADADMLAEAARQADERHLRHITWRHLRAEELPADLPPMDAITLAQSFHWMDRDRVARAARRLLSSGGAVVHVSANTHQGTDEADDLPYPQPPHEAITGLVKRYLGPQRRAGQGVVPDEFEVDEDAVYGGAGLRGPEHLEVPGRIVTRTVDEVVAAVFSLSSAAPHLFGDRLNDFERDLRALLASVSEVGTFSEHMPPIGLDIWR